MNRNAAITALAGLLLATGCTTGGTDPKPPTPTPERPSPTASPTATLGLPEHKASCTEALVKRGERQTGPLQSDPQPTECLGLENRDFLDAYYKALIEVNRKRLEERQSARPTT